MRQDLPRVVVAAGRQDRTALARIYDSVAPRLYRFATLNLGADDVARDVVDDVVPEVLASIPHYDPDAPSVEAYCMAVAFGVMARRRKEALPRSAFDLPSTYLDESTAATTDGSFESDVLRASLRQLPPLWQELIGLRFFAGLDLEEAGYVLNKSVGPLREVEERALTALGEWMTQLSSERVSDEPVTPATRDGQDDSDVV